MRIFDRLFHFVLFFLSLFLFSACNDRGVSLRDKFDAKGLRPVVNREGRTCDLYPIKTTAPILTQVEVIGGDPTVFPSRWLPPEFGGWKVSGLNLYQYHLITPTGFPLDRNKDDSENDCWNIIAWKLCQIFSLPFSYQDCRKIAYDEKLVKVEDGTLNGTLPTLELSSLMKLLTEKGGTLKQVNQECYLSSWLGKDITGSRILELGTITQILFDAANGGALICSISNNSDSNESLEHLVMLTKIEFSFDGFGHQAHDNWKAIGTGQIKGTFGFPVIIKLEYFDPFDGKMHECLNEKIIEFWRKVTTVISINIKSNAGHS